MRPYSSRRTRSAADDPSVKLCSASSTLMLGARHCGRISNARCTILGVTPVDGSSSSNTFGSITSACDRQHRLLTAGQRAGTPRHPISPGRKRREHVLLQCLMPCLRTKPAGEIEIIANRQPRRQLRPTQHVSDAGAHDGFDGAAADRFTPQEDMGRLCRQPPGDDTKQRRLAGAILTEYDNHFAGCQRQRDVSSGDRAVCHQLGAAKQLDAITVLTGATTQHRGINTKPLVVSHRRTISISRSFSVASAASRLPPVEAPPAET